MQPASGLQGAPSTLALNIADAPASGGFNAHVVLPAGVTVTGVSAGALLSAAGGFNIAYDFTGPNLKVVAYSATSSFSGAGTLVNLQLAVQPSATPGYYETGFAAADGNLLVNSEHALSNNDGSQSLPHTVVGEHFLVYSSTSDNDGDGMPDRWELANGLLAAGPTGSTGEHGANGDPDTDGVYNRDEYRTGTNPGNNLSKPEGANGVSYVLFRDRFNDAKYDDRWFVGPPDPGALFQPFESGEFLDEKLLQPVNGCQRAELRSIATLDATNHVYRALVKLENHGKTLIGLMQNNDTGNRIELQFDTTGTPALQLRSVENGVATETPAGTPVSYTNQDVEIRLVSRPIAGGGGNDYFVFVNRILQFSESNATITGTALRPFLAAESCTADGGYVFSHFDLVEILKDRDADGLADGFEDTDFDGVLDSRETNPLVADMEGDGHLDGFDNCTLIASASQCDSDGDGFGNRCDADFGAGGADTGNGIVNAQDTTRFRLQLGQPSTAPSYNKADLNCNGVVNAQDTTLFRLQLGTAPGPSGLKP